MKKTAFISDVIFTFFSVGLCTLCVFRYLRFSLPIAFFLSTICGALASCSVFFLLQSKRKTVFLKKSDEAKKEKLLLHLALLSDEQKTAYFERLFSIHQPVRVFGKLRLYTNEQFFQIHYGFTPLSLENVAAFSRLKTNKRKVLVYRSAQEDALALAARLQIQAIPPEQIFKIVKEHDLFPVRYLGEEQPQNKRKRKLRICFSKQNGKRFFTSGLSLFVLSLLTPFAYYYLIFGGLLLLLSAIIRIFGYERADV